MVYESCIPQVANENQALFQQKAPRNILKQGSVLYFATFAQRRSCLSGYSEAYDRAQYAGALYHVMNRGDRRADIYLDDEDRLCFLKSLVQACERQGGKFHASCLMWNHFHLVVEPPPSQSFRRDEMAPPDLLQPLQILFSHLRHCRHFKRSFMPAPSVFSSSSCHTD